MMDPASRKFVSALKFALTLIAAWGLFLLVLSLTGTERTVSSGIPVGAADAASAPFFQLTLPPEFYAEAESFEGGEVEYHLNLRHGRGLAHGFLEILFMGTELNAAHAAEAYLETAERYRSANISELKKSASLMGSCPAVVWEYEYRGTETADPLRPEDRAEGGGQAAACTIRALQGFAVKKERLYTLALFADTQKLSATALREIFDGMMSDFVF